MATELYKEWLLADQEFATEMKQIAEIITRNGPVYIDNHTGEQKTLSRINICSFVRTPFIWCFPGGCLTLQCKNPLRVHNNKLYLSTCAQGITLSEKENEILTKDGILEQYGDEMNISL